MRFMLGGAILAFVVLLAATIPSPYVIERPGPVVDTLGKITIEGETEDVIRLEGVDTYPTTGRLNLLTVTTVGSPQQPVDWLSLVPALLDRTQQITPMSSLFPEGTTEDDRDAVNTALMGSSQTRSVAAALDELGEPVPVMLRVGSVAEDGPAEGILEQGDLLVAVGADPVEDFESLRAAVASSGAGSEVELLIERSGERRTETVTPEIPEGGEDPLLGITVVSEYDLPFEVTISLDEIGGPSAGMIFALAIYDELTPGSLTDGIDVSGTGTIGESGEVGPIGGLSQKMWGAARAGSDLMLIPVGNCGDVPDRLPEGLRLAPVATLSEAIAAVETAADGGTPPGLERCPAE
ncbi:PDZ domain-containing protein [Leucobacter sp. CSA1]|uniref:PDZ domain-containing protein n=2 Tax=Leucobacter chromiisoli TaxID=2796471 RepID=A0A934UVA3_9MICO|nr:PDZ domain-containing protein [Leucobacter chromiisoli]